MSKPVAIVFAGVPGSSKSIVAHYLSCEFNLPIFNNDVIRSEVKEDLLEDNINNEEAIKEFEVRYDSRLNYVLSKKRNIILDGSVDRKWDYLKHLLQKYGYDWFLINMDMSKEFMINLYSHTKRPNSIKQLDDYGYMNQHDDFNKKYSNDVNISIKDKTFLQRNKIVAKAFREFLDTKN